MPDTRVEYQKENRIFIVRLQALNNIADVEAIYRLYRQCFQANIAQQNEGGFKYKILLDGRQHPHDNINVDRKIREQFSADIEADENNICEACAIVAPPDRMPGQSKMQRSESECFFVDIDEALLWLCSSITNFF